MFFVGGIALLVLVIAGSNWQRQIEIRPTPRSAAPTPFTERTVHIDGRDLNGDMLALGVPFHSGPHMSGRRLGRLQHGDVVTLLESNGYAARIRTSSGVEGWVDEYFVQELRDPAVPL
jgi:hypothetical protein